MAEIDNGNTVRLAPVRSEPLETPAAGLELRLRERLEALQAEHGKGRQALQELESQAASVRATLLRISGAVQVLQESLGDAPEAAPPQWPGP